MATDPTGVVTGFGFCAASATDQQVAETFFAVRHRPNPRLPLVGYVGSRGERRSYARFEGEENHRRWLDLYGVRIIHLSHHAFKGLRDGGLIGAAIPPEGPLEGQVRTHLGVDLVEGRAAAEDPHKGIDQLLLGGVSNGLLRDLNARKGFEHSFLEEVVTQDAKGPVGSLRFRGM